MQFDCHCIQPRPPTAPKNDALAHGEGTAEGMAGHPLGEPALIR
jgi:hypothetical protein